MTATSTSNELVDSVCGALAQFEPELSVLSDKIWADPEIGLEEHAASVAQQALLQRYGFAVEAGVAGMDTAFVARRSVGGSGPTIGLLGEFDALPGLSQDRVPYRRPVVEHGLGHGCGHNLLGTGALGAALVAAHVAAAHDIAVDVAYFGCPAEESLVGKVVMAREQLFEDLDAALSWHPYQFNTLWDGSALALDAMSFRFAGRSAHASSTPQNGRCALDAVELMNVGVNFLREHMSSDARIHYIIRSGGEVPNVIPAHAVSDYRVRERTRHDVQQLRERVFDCARGAALMTGTKASWRLTAACASLLPNDALGEVLLDALRVIGPPAFDDADRNFAAAIRETLTSEQLDEARQAERVPSELYESMLHERVDAPFRPGALNHGSTDVGDVSWNVPTAQLYVATMPIGTPSHSWQLTASSGASVGRKGMLTAAAALALATVQLAARPRRLDEARREFDRRTAGRPYVTPIPAGIIPPGDLAPQAGDDRLEWLPL